MTIFMLFQWLTGKIKAASARFASALSTRTWVQQRSLSNRLMLMRCCEGVDFRPKSCKIHALLAQPPAVTPRKSRNWMRGATQLAGGQKRSVPTDIYRDQSWWARRQRAFAHPTSLRVSRHCMTAGIHRLISRLLEQRYQSAAVALEPPGKFEFEQHGADDARRGRRDPDQVVETDRARSQQADNACAIACPGFEVERLGVVRLAQFDRPLHDRCDGMDDIRCLRDQRRALLDQFVGPGGARVERRTRHREHLAALFGGNARGDQRARAVRGLDHDDAERDARDQP